MDYSIHDAIAAGFNKIIIVIRKNIENDFIIEETYVEIETNINYEDFQDDIYFEKEYSGRTKNIAYLKINEIDNTFKVFFQNIAKRFFVSSVCIY